MLQLPLKWKTGAPTSTWGKKIPRSPILGEPSVTSASGLVHCAWCSEHRALSCQGPPVPSMARTYNQCVVGHCVATPCLSDSTMEVSQSNPCWPQSWEKICTWSCQRQVPVTLNVQFLKRQDFRCIPVHAVSHQLALRSSWTGCYNHPPYAGWVLGLGSRHQKNRCCSARGSLE